MEREEKENKESPDSEKKEKAPKKKVKLNFLLRPKQNHSEMRIIDEDASRRNDHTKSQSGSGSIFDNSDNNPVFDYRIKKSR